MWSKGTERNLKLIEAFFPWEVSPDQDTLRTMPKRWRLEEISGSSQFASSTQINFQVGKLLHEMDVYKTYCHLRGTPNVEVMQVSI